MSSNPYINNIYKRWKDIKEYIDSRIQYNKILLYNKLITIINEGLQTLNDTKQDKLKEGKNITISNNVISAEGESYTAGQNIDITFNSISAKGYRYDVNLEGFAEGQSTTASGQYSHAEGYSTTASDCSDHAEGEYTEATGYASHAEGSYTKASGQYSHAEGDHTKASSASSHAEGYYTTTTNTSEHAEGHYNVSHHASIDFDDAGNTQHSIGIGSSSIRRNAFEIMQNGDMYVYGVGGYQGIDTKVQDSAIKTLQEYFISIESIISDNEEVTAAVFDKIRNVIGADENAKVTFSGTNNLDGCESLLEAILLLDAKLKNE